MNESVLKFQTHFEAHIIENVDDVLVVGFASPLFLMQSVPNLGQFVRKVF